MLILLKHSYKCVGGPWHGVRLYLHGDGSTAVFSVGNWHGRYNRGEWESV